MYINTTKLSAELAGGSMPDLNTDASISDVCQSMKRSFIDIWDTLCTYTDQLLDLLDPVVLVWGFLALSASVVVGFVIYGAYEFLVYLVYGPREYCQRPRVIEHDFSWFNHKADRLFAEQKAKIAADKAWCDAVPQYHYCCSTRNHPDISQWPRKSYTFTSQDRYLLADSKGKGLDDDSSDCSQTSREEADQYNYPYVYHKLQEGHGYGESYRWWIFRPKKMPIGVRYVYSWKEPEYI